jgi:hypothetical protein
MAIAPLPARCLSVYDALAVVTDASSLGFASSSKQEIIRAKAQILFRMTWAARAGKWKRESDGGIPTAWV